MFIAYSELIAVHCMAGSCGVLGSSAMSQYSVYKLRLAYNGAFRYLLSEP